MRENHTEVKHTGTKQGRIGQPGAEPGRMGQPGAEPGRTGQPGAEPGRTGQTGDEPRWHRRYTAAVVAGVILLAVLGVVVLAVTVTLRSSRDRVAITAGTEPGNGWEDAAVAGVMPAAKGVKPPGVGEHDCHVNQFHSRIPGWGFQRKHFV